MVFLKKDPKIPKSTILDPRTPAYNALEKCIISTPAQNTLEKCIVSTPPNPKMTGLADQKCSFLGICRFLDLRKPDRNPK